MRLREESRRPFDLSRDLMIARHSVRAGAYASTSCSSSPTTSPRTVGRSACSAGMSASATGRGARTQSLVFPSSRSSTATSRAGSAAASAASTSRASSSTGAPKLAGAPTVAELPSDRPRPARQTFEGGEPSGRASGRGRRGDAASRPRAERHAVHAAARAFRGASLPPHRPGRHPHRQPVCQPAPQ